MATKEDDTDKTDKDENAHSLDMSQAAVKKMIAEARDRGYITYDQLNTVLPPEQVNSEQIEDVMSMLSEMGINVIEDEDEADEAEGGAVATTASGSREVAVAATETEKLDRTDDPVRMKTVMGHCVPAWRPSSWLGHWYLHCRSHGNLFD